MKILTNKQLRPKQYYFIKQLKNIKFFKLLTTNFLQLNLGTLFLQNQNFIRIFEKKN